MYKTFQELFRLIRRAKKFLYIDPPCKVTARACLKMAEDTTFELLQHAIDNRNYECLRRACNYSQNYCLQEKYWENVVIFMEIFWFGVQDGIFNRRFKKDQSEYYKIGYEMIRYGR